MSRSSNRRAHNPILAETGLTERSWPTPWFGGKKLLIQLP